jgi:peptidyl-prolyl cis-trans isomerase SurA
MKMTTLRLACRKMQFALPIMAALTLVGISTSPVQAQAVVASVNDDPITNVDIEQHMRILRAMSRPATREAALESIYETRLKLIETSKYKISPSDSDVGWALGFTSRAMKLDPQAVLNNLQRSGVMEDQWKQKFKAEAAWMQLIRALNRSIEPSESEVEQELARTGKSKSTEYVLRQIIFVVPNNASPGVVESRASEANQLRARFTDCATGIPLATSLRDVAVREPVTRYASALSEQLRKILDSTQAGRLTPVSRSQQGIELLAVCSKGEKQDQNAAENVRSDLLFKKLQKESERRYQDVRSKAVIVTKR